MRQQINLYQPIFSEQRKPLSFRLVASIFLLAVAGLIAYSVHAYQQLKALESSVEDLRNQQAEPDALAYEASPSAENEIDERIKGLERALEARRAALHVLQSGGAGQPVGFAARMEALARRHIDGLWIDQLTLSGTNGAMSLGGVARHPDIVPVYLRNLASDSVLSGTRFDEFVIERPAAANSTAAAPHVAATPPSHVRFRAGSKSLPTGIATENST